MFCSDTRREGQGRAAGAKAVGERPRRPQTRRCGQSAPGRRVRTRSPRRAACQQHGLLPSLPTEKTGNVLCRDVLPEGFDSHKQRGIHDGQLHHCRWETRTPERCRCHPSTRASPRESSALHTSVHMDAFRVHHQHRKETHKASLKCQQILTASYMARGSDAGFGPGPAGRPRATPFAWREYF